MNISVSRSRLRAASHMLLAATVCAAVFVPRPSFACACGCGIFDVGAITLPSEMGLLAWFRYSYMNQNTNWEGTSKASPTDNGDKWINTNFYTAGAEYSVNDNWMVMAELPVYARQLKTTDDGAGDVTGIPYGVYTGHLTSLGDLQLSTVYTGIADDMSTGLTLGLKLPTGDYTGPNSPNGNHGAEFDRDSLPGTGSTDLMLGAYHVGSFTNDERFGYFVQARYQFAMLTRDEYRPGNELDGATGLTYNFGTTGPFDKTGLVLQFLGSWRQHDQGFNADPPNSGYRRILIAPGVDLQVKRFRFYADVELPLYQDVNAAWNGGDTVDTGGTKGQLIASALYKLEVAYAF
jgi:hypothetical protein